MAGITTKCPFIAHIMTSINSIAALCAVHASNADDRDVYWFIETTQSSAIVVRETIDAITTIIGANHAMDHLIVYDVVNDVLTYNAAVIDDKSLQSQCRRTEAIFYPHDMSGKYPQILVRLFPTAHKVCYGDALGHVFEKRVHLVNKIKAWNSINTRQPSTLYNYFTQSLAKFAHKRELRRTSIYPDQAVLILPVDESGEYLRHCQLTVCRKEDVLRVLQAAGQEVNIPETSVWGAFLANPGEDRCLLMTECWSEAGFISPEADIEMYAGVILERYPAGGEILVKPHPSEILDRVSLLQKRMGKEYRIARVDDAFVRLPIELFADRLRKVRIITAAYAVLSLKYLFDIDVDFFADDKLLRTYLPAHWYPVLNDGFTIYNGSLSSLPAWDQNSVLFSGNIKAR